MPGGDEAAGAVLVLAPRGRDAELAAATLKKTGIAARVYKNLAELAQGLGESTNAVLIAEEGLVPSELLLLLDVLGQQPTWSDIPVIILTAPGGGDRASLQALEIFGPAANVTLLERPLRAVTLVATVKVALRARRRQREVRDLLQQRESVLSSISDAFSALDRDWRYTYVNDRVAELAGLAKDEMVGRVIWDIFPEVVGTEFYDRCHRARENQQPEHFEIFYEPWQRWLDTRIYPTKEGIVIFGLISPNGENRKPFRENQRRLQELEQRSRVAVEAANVGTFDFYSTTGNCCGRTAATRSSGCARLEVDYQTYLKGVHPDDRHIIHETVRDVLNPESGGRYDIEYRTIGIQDGEERWISEKAGPSRPSDTPPVLSGR
jgi:PAS domain S-box-containing protein